MKRVQFPAMTTVAVVLAVFGRRAISAQDKYTLQVPDGLRILRLQGIRRLADRLDQSDRRCDRCDSRQSGDDRRLPGRRSRQRQALPRRLQDSERSTGSRKRVRKPPAPTTVPDTLHDVDFMEKDSKKFSDTGGWGYAQFNYDAASDTFTPDGNGAKCGSACHTIVREKITSSQHIPRGQSSLSRLPQRSCLRTGRQSHTTLRGTPGTPSGHSKRGAIPFAERSRRLIGADQEFHQRPLLGRRRCAPRRRAGCIG